MDENEIYQKGFEYRCNGQYAEAKAEFNRLLASNPSHVKARMQVGLIQGFEGDFDGSMATLAALSAEVPHDLDVRYELAMTQLMLGDFDAGCANIRHILSVDPTHEKALQQSAYC
ncbi:MAG TPA: tetratricopeptide repeat protein [Fimbriimonadaceae bacterium]|nr:tetratricopeptide repeat protein [Fimbriimonadaceae bacterium]